MIKTLYHEILDDAAGEVESYYDIRINGSMVTEVVKVPNEKAKTSKLASGAAGYAVARRRDRLNQFPVKSTMDPKLTAVLEEHPSMHWAAVMSQVIHSMAGLAE